jgi:hypothetical protein
MKNGPPLHIWERNRENNKEIYGFTHKNSIWNKEYNIKDPKTPITNRQAACTK